MDIPLWPVSFAILRVGKDELPEFAGGITSLVVVEVEVGKVKVPTRGSGFYDFSVSITSLEAKI